MSTDDSCSNPSHKKYFRTLVPFGSLAGTEPVSVRCGNCGKAVEYNRDKNEVAFLDFLKPAGEDSTPKT